MCYNYSNNKSPGQIKDRYSGIRDDYNLLEEYNSLFHVGGFNFKKSLVITNDNPFTFQAFSWGLIPGWTQTKQDAQKIRSMTLNARSDSIFEKPAYRNAAKYGNRCLIPADGIFEWHKLNKKSYPYYIHLKNHEMFSMAGIWDEWADKETGEILKTFALITTNANPLMSRIHNDGTRMPVILPLEHEIQWLNKDLSEKDVLELCTSYPDEKMISYTVSKLLNTRGINTNMPEVLLPYKYAELEQPTLF